MSFRRLAGSTTAVALVSVLFLAPIPAAWAQITPQCVTGCLGTISVTPDGGPLAVSPNTSGNNASFNLDFISGTTTSRTFALTCSKSGGVICGTITPSSVTLQGPADEAGVNVAFGVTSTGGTLTLRAMYGTGSIEDVGWYNILVRGAPAIALRNHNRDNVDRSLCLTAGAGEAAAWSCGDLTIAHAMPGFVTLARERSPTLLHNSATTSPRPAVAAVVTQPSGRAQPSAVFAELQVSGVVRASATYTGWASGTGGARQVVLDYSAASDSTGAYPIRFRVQNQYTGFASYDAFVDDTILVVNRSYSEFGAGFGLVGLERLYFNQPVGTALGHILWVGGDGSAKLYRKLNATTWVAPLGAFQDTVTYDGTNYTRTGRHRVQVKFDNAGRHVETRPRTGQVTTFTWTAGNRLNSIVLPPIGQAYTFVWDGNANLNYVDDPAGRRLDVSIAANRQVSSILDPDGKGVEFGWDGTQRIVWRKDRRNFVTSYQYSQGLAYGSRLTRVTIPAGTALTDTVTSVTVYEPWNDKGLAVAATGQVAVDTGQAYTKILGPRPNVADDATFWVDRWGAPTKIQNAIGAITTITRANPLFPALATSIKFPNGRNVTIEYNTRGNDSLTRDINSVGSVGAGAMPTKVTAYTYGNSNAPDSPTIVADSINGGAYRSLYTYTTDGLTQTATDRRGHVTRFGIRASGPLRGVVDSVIEEQVETWSVGGTDLGDALANQVVTFTYDNSGNVIRTKSPAGLITSSERDNKGRVTDTYDPLGFHQRWVYDQLNRITRTVRFTAKTGHPGGVDPLQDCDAAQVFCGDSTRAPGVALGDSLPTTYHLGDATLDSITDPRGNTRRFVYDARGLLFEERDEIWNLPRLATYDRSGALTRSLGRRYPPVNTPNPHQDTVHVEYDVLGRRVKEYMSCTPYNTSCPGGAEVVPSDTTRYTYDNMNNLLTVNNANGTITRTYYGDGSIRTQKVVLPDGTDSAAYSYDSTGARTRLARTSAGKTEVITYSYHPTSGDLQSMTVAWGDPVNASRTFSFTWDALGRRRQITYPTGIVVRFRYDKQGTLRRLVSSNPASTGVADRFDFTYRADSVDASGRTLFQHTTCASGADAGQPGSACSPASPQNLTISSRYDRLGMLVWQKSSDEVPTQEFAYDQAGNLIYRKRNGDEHYFRIANLGNQLLADSMPGDLASEIVNFRYTANGARQREFFANEATGGSDTKLFYYDGRGRPSGVRDLAHDIQNRVTCLKYDPDGQLALPCDDNPSWLTFDGSNVASTLGTNRWVFVSGLGVDDPLIGLYRDPSAPVKEFYWVTDGNGRQLAVGLEDGSLSGNDRTNYFFNGGKFAGGTENATSFDASRFETTIAPKLSYFRNRIYDQETGRWTQEDPIGVAGGLNLYQFNNNNPVSYTDPFGLRTCPPNCGTIHAAGALAFGTLGAVRGAVLGSPGGVPGIVIGAALGGGSGIVAGVAAGNVAEATAEAANSKEMATFGDYIRRLLVAGGIAIGEGVPDRTKGSENPPEVEQPAKPPKPDEKKPKEEQEGE